MGYLHEKVYADRSLGIDPMAKFDLPEDYNPCGRKAEEDDFTENGIDEVLNNTLSS